MALLLTLPSTPTSLALPAALGLSAALMALAGCSSTPEEASPSPSIEATPTPFPSERAFEVQFEAQVGDEPFACDTSYPNMGTSASTFTPMDFRVYISELVLLDASGIEHPVSLTQDGAWQYQDVALLDFEDASGTCTGTAETNTRIQGVTAGGDYTGIRFTVGVPFALNHLDASTAPSPLNVTSMFWSWNSGYRFLRLDGASTGQTAGFAVHVGSTECEKNAEGTVTSCANPNRAEITLSGFDPLSTPIVVDIAALFSELDIDTNTSGSAALCMSTADDPECWPVFESLGLPFDDSPANPSAQTVFRVE